METTTSSPETNGINTQHKADKLLVMKVVHNRPFVREKNKAGRWGRPVVDNDGNFYKSSRALSEALKLDASYTKRIVEKKSMHNGKQYSYASVEQARAYVLAHLPETAKQFKPVKPLRKRVRKSSAKAKAEQTAAAKPVAAKPAAAKVEQAAAALPLPFIGVQWPDDTVTVRLASGGNWQMTRMSRYILPVEILNNTKWL